ncbi:phage protein NinX family protein [Proteus terrae]|uniref:phage protein NinX family protein n=1 Tax=Proteus terrae TaxID=1574161 RepID=UPI0032DB5734
MNKYTELSDFEINKNVFIKLYGEASLKDKDMFNSFYRADYCHNPEDAMPIIIENKIAMNPKDDIWQCGSGWNVAENKNPLRACMEAFLMMKEAEDNK